MPLIQSNKPLKEGEVFNKWLESRLIRNNKNVLTAVTGQTGCLSGDTLIKISRAKNTTTHKIKDLYLKFNRLEKKHKRKTYDATIPFFIRGFNGEEIRLHKIMNVFSSGIKKVYKLTLDNGLSIKATADHKILTKDNGWIELCNLKNEYVMCDTLNAEASNRKRIKLRDIGLNVGENHPYNIQPNKQISVHVLIYEARLNNLSFTDYLDILLNEPEQCKSLKFIDPKIFTIHHIDGCHYNNSIDNLKCMKRKEHYFEHNQYTNFSQGIPKFSKVISLEYFGEEETYDIECEKPHHNFVANGIVVHNSGKSYQDLRRAELWYKKHFKKEFPEENICFSIAEVMRRVSSGKLKRGEIIIFEEAGANLGSLDFQGKVQKLFTYVLQTFRTLNVAIFFNLPYLSMLNKSARLLIHVRFETCGIDYKTEVAKSKAYFRQVNQASGKVYEKFLRIRHHGKIQVIKKFNYLLPSEKLRKAYEKKKLKFVTDMNVDFVKELDILEKEKIRKAMRPSLTDIQMRTYNLLVEHKGNVKKVANIRGVTERTIYDVLVGVRKKGYDTYFKENA